MPAESAAADPLFKDALIVVNTNMERAYVNKYLANRFLRREQVAPIFFFVERRP